MAEECYFGTDCPDDMVQLELIRVDAEPLPHAKILPGYKPGRTVTVEIYVGGRRFIIMAGRDAELWGQHGPCLYIQTECGVEVKATAVNAAMVKLDSTGEQIFQKVRAERRAAQEQP